jgi:predicted outer membrane repeat protein
MQASCEVNVKKLSVLALVAALLTGACGTIEYSDVNVIPSNTLYVTLEWPTDAPDNQEDPDWNTSCSNPAVAVDELDVAGDLAVIITEGAYGTEVYGGAFGVIHLCAGTYETDEIIQFLNLGSITIEGDGMDETIISGADGDDHALLAMVPAECSPEVEPCPSYFNVLTLKDLTLTNGVGGNAVFDIVGETPMLAGGAVTAPLIATERVRFSNNSAPCGGAVALYGWTQLASDGELAGINDDEDALATAEYLSSLISLGSSQITDTEFIENSATIGGAIGGAPLGDFAGGEEIISCLNAGPLSIVNSTFVGNQAIVEAELPLGIGGGAIATANLIVLEIVLAGADEVEEALAIFDGDTWLNIANSTFTDNDSGSEGGAVLSYGKTSISRTTFTNNDVSGAGGAIAVAGELSLSYSKLVGNSASSGGAVALLDGIGGGHVLTRNTFIRNVATDQGGAITGWTDAGSARGNRFTSNRAPVGSAVAVETERCSRTWSRRAARDWRGNTFRRNSGGRLPVECYVFVAPEPS